MIATAAKRMRPRRSEIARGSGTVEYWFPNNEVAAIPAGLVPVDRVRSLLIVRDETGAKVTSVSLLVVGASMKVVQLVGRPLQNCSVYRTFPPFEVVTLPKSM